MRFGLTWRPHSPCASIAGTLCTVGPRSLSAVRGMLSSPAGLTERAGPPPPRFRSAAVDGRSYGVAEAIASGSVCSRRNRPLATRVCPLLAGYTEVSRSGGAHAPLRSSLGRVRGVSRPHSIEHADELRWTPLRSSPPPHAGVGASAGALPTRTSGVGVAPPAP